MHSITKIQEQKRIIDALERFVRNDMYLLAENANERTMTAKLAEYLQDLFPMYHIDCEYRTKLNTGHASAPLDMEHVVNMFRNEIKRLNGEDPVVNNSPQTNLDEGLAGLHELASDFSGIFESYENVNREIIEFGIYLVNVPGLGKELKTVFPDIVAHVRGTGRNVFAIEAKKMTTVKSKSTSSLIDILKLSAMRRQKELKYERGYFVQFPNLENSKTCLGFVSPKQVSAASVVEGIFEIKPRI